MENEIANIFGDSSPNKRNILIIGQKNCGKTFILQKWITNFKPSKQPLVLHEKENEWNRLNGDVKASRIGLLNRKSYLRELVKGRVVIVDDALNLTKNYADKLLGLASVNRELDSSFVVSLQGLGVLKERKDALNIFDTVIFFKGSEGCAFLVKNTTRFSKEVELIRKKIEELNLYEILVYDRETNLWYKSTNEDVELFNELLTKPLTKGEKLEVRKQSSEGSSNNFQMESKKCRIKKLAEKGVDRRKIIKDVDTSAGYVTKVLSELRLEGHYIPKLKVGRPSNYMQPDSFILKNRNEIGGLAIV